MEDAIRILDLIQTISGYCVAVVNAIIVSAFIAAPELRKRSLALLLILAIIDCISSLGAGNVGTVTFLYRRPFNSSAITRHVTTHGHNLYNDTSTVLRTYGEIAAFNLFIHVGYPLCCLTTLAIALERLFVVWSPKVYENSKDKFTGCIVCFLMISALIITGCSLTTKHLLEPLPLSLTDTNEALNPAMLKTLPSLEVGFSVLTILAYLAALILRQKEKKRIAAAQEAPDSDPNKLLYAIQAVRMQRRHKLGHLFQNVVVAFCCTSLPGSLLLTVGRLREASSETLVALFQALGTLLHIANAFINFIIYWRQCDEVRAIVILMSKSIRRMFRCFQRPHEMDSSNASSFADA